MLSEAGLGTDRLLAELEGKLSAENVRIVGEKIARLPDNRTQMRALELLADVLGVRKQNIDIAHRGSIKVQMDKTIYEAVHGDADGGDTDPPEVDK